MNCEGAAKAPAGADPAGDRLRLLGMMDLAAIMVRDFDGTIRFWSEGCRRLYGWAAAQVIGQSSHSLLQTVFPVPLAEIDAALLRDGEWCGDLRQRSRDGAEVVVAARKVLHRADGGCLSVMENVTDATALRAAEDALRESRAQLHAVVETAAEGIVTADAGGRILSANRAAVQMFGYDRADELIGRDLGVLMPPAEAERHRGYVAAHSAGAQPRAVGVPGRELLAVRRDGSAFPIDLSMTSFGTGAQRCLTGIIRDATVRKQGETALRDSEARLRLAQRVGRVASTDRRIAETEALVSAEYVRIYGLPAGQTHIPVAAWLALVHPEDRERLAEGMLNVREHGDTFEMEFRIRRPDGSLRWLAMRAEAFPGQDGKPVRVITAQQDITETVSARETLTARKEELKRHVAERTSALAKAEAQFRAVFDSQLQSIGLLSPDGSVVEVNRTALELIGVAHDEVIGRPFWETGWWPAGERDRLRDDIAEAAQGAVIRREAENLCADGYRIWIDFSLKPVPDPVSGQTKWIIAEGRNVTERRELAEKLSQAQKVEALGQIAGGIAHDFNNILQSVSGAAMLIERRPEDHARTRRLARATIEAAARGASITRRLLSFARRGAQRSEAIAPEEVLDSMREVLAHTIGSAITVRTDCPAGLPPLLADRGQLETALVNLGTNARDAMPGGGILTLSAEAVEVADGGEAPGGIAPGAYVRVSVADTGAGMDAATFARAAEPFFTTKPPGSGTGLGLAMVKGFAEQSGGAMTVTSTPGAGTTVSLWLGQAKDTLPYSRTGEDGVRPARPAPARILLVDDDSLVRATLAAELEDLGFAALVAASGDEALALIEAGEAVDALVSDLSMPGINGAVTIQKARGLRPGLPCFLLTGYVGERAALAAGDAFTLVRKPVSGQALAARIEASLEAAKQ